MNEPRPRITSARPFDSASTVAKRWNTRTGSSELSTVTPDPRRMRAVRVAIPASTVSGVEIEYSGRWCSPSGDGVDAELVGQHASSTTCRIAAAVRDRLAGVVNRHVAERVESEQRVSVMVVPFWEVRDAGCTVVTLSTD